MIGTFPASSLRADKLSLLGCFFLSFSHSFFSFFYNIHPSYRFPLTLSPSPFTQRRMVFQISQGRKKRRDPRSRFFLDDGPACSLSLPSLRCWQLCRLFFSPLSFSDYCSNGSCVLEGKGGGGRAGTVQDWNVTGEFRLSFPQLFSLKADPQFLKAMDVNADQKSGRGLGSGKLRRPDCVKGERTG